MNKPIIIDFDNDADWGINTQHIDKKQKKHKSNKVTAVHKITPVDPVNKIDDFKFCHTCNKSYAQNYLRTQHRQTKFHLRNAEKHQEQLAKLNKLVQAIIEYDNNELSDK